jgi:hypothetical protein
LLWELWRHTNAPGHFLGSMELLILLSSHIRISLICIMLYCIIKKSR